MIESQAGTIFKSNIARLLWRWAYKEEETIIGALFLEKPMLGHTLVTLRIAF
jgi:hypothetical protein